MGEHQRTARERRSPHAMNAFAAQLVAGRVVADSSGTAGMPADYVLHDSYEAAMAAMDAEEAAATDSSGSLPSYVGACIVVGFVSLLGVGVLSKRFLHERRIAQAAREGEELRQNPRHFTPEQLKAYDGRDISRPLLLALKGRVMDVSTGSDYYGPEGAYKFFAGKDASYAFAMMSLKLEDAHADLTGVPDEHLKILDDWYDKLTKKYPTVGRM